MSELRFLIVNNHLPHSVAEKSKLDSRVSFPVYQDTEDRDIWRRMRGGKDDVFIYDRCGRLAYFIPFPLSIMNTEDALVPAAILATYFQSPCGASCDPSPPPPTPSSFDEDEHNDTTDAMLDFTTPLYPSTNSSLEEHLNSTNPFSDLDYLSSLEDEDDYNETDVARRHHNDLMSFVVLDNNGTDVVANETVMEEPVVFNSNRSNEIPVFESSSFSNDTEGENATVSTTTTTTQVPRKKSDRCAEADMSVCRTWSKRKLLRAQTCCNNGVHTAALGESCKNYGKKRCKKIRTLLKCCLKTSYIEGKTDDNTTANDDVRTNNTDVKVNATTSPDDVTVEVTTVVDYVVCCREGREGQRTCRVSLEGACEAGETVSEDGLKLQTN